MASCPLMMIHGLLSLFISKYCFGILLRHLACS